MLGIEPSWLLAGLVAIHLVTLAYAYWRRSASAGSEPDRHEALEALDGRAETPDVETGPDVETVTCAHCGTVNAAEYHFCRNCVADLRSGGPDDDAPTAAFGSGSV